MTADGNSNSEASFEPSTLVELLRRRAQSQPEQQAYTFLLDGQADAVALTYSELDRRARRIAARLQKLGETGGRVLLLYPPGLDYVAGFFTCLYAGAVAVPVYPPRRTRNLARLQTACEDAQATAALTTKQILSTADQLYALAPELKRLQWLATDDDAGNDENNWIEPDVTSNTLAFIQYTSGSTGTPKGVMLTHANLLHNQHMIRSAFQHTNKTIVVGWLPIYHDMGLIGNMLQPLYLGVPAILMSPTHFLQKPVRWLQAISRYRATTSGGPNFAYDLCVRKVTPEERESLDLSSWTVVFNGSEPVRADTLDRFTEYFSPCGFRLEAFCPCYGLAEATLLVSGSSPHQPPAILAVQADALEGHRVVEVSGSAQDAQILVGCGQEPPDQKIIIVDPEKSVACPPDRVGEIWISGPGVAQGYWNQTDETLRTFRSILADAGEGPFLRTGDLGFVRNGELFITGRIKDLIIIRGRNYYPQDIELSVERSHAGLRPDCGAAFSIETGGEERLVVVHELDKGYQRDADEVIKTIRRAVAEDHDVQVHAVVLIKPWTIPKTSSGKIQRNECRRRYLNGDLNIIETSVLDDADAAVDEELFWRESAPEEEADLRSSALQRRLRQQTARLLKLPPARIDPREPLSALGLDSLAAVELQHKLETDYGLILPAGTYLGDFNLIQLVSEVSARGPTAVSGTPISRTSVQESVTTHPLSRGQRAMWFINRLKPESPVYNIASAIRIRTELDLPALKRALQTLVDRHPALRSTFVTMDGEPRQKINAHQQVCFKHEDASAWDESDLKKRLVEQAHRPFDLEHDSLLRIHLLTRSPREHLLLFNVHHIVADFWSLTILVRELIELYAAEKAGVAVSLRPLTRTYADFVRWQEEVLTGSEGERLWSYWEKQLSGELPTVQLPSDRPHTDVQSYRGAVERFKLSAELTRGLEQLSRTQGATLYTTLLAAWATLLHRYGGQEELLIGSPMAGRSRAEFAGVVGYFVNLVPLRINLAGDPTFSVLLKGVREMVLEAIKHQDYPFALMVERLRPQRDTRRSPLIDVVFVFQKAQSIAHPDLAALALGDEEIRLDFGELSLEPVALEQRSSQFDLTLTMAEVSDGLAACLQYNTDIIEAATIRRMAGHLQRLLEGIINDTDQPLSKLPLLNDQERHQILAEFNDTKTAYPADVCLHELIEKQVERTPDAPAAIYEDQQLTYRELNERANQLANLLRSLGAGPDVLVGICVERSVEMVVGLLGILKAGGVYVPLDPNYPRERLSFMAADARTPVLLAQQRLLDILPEYHADVIRLDADAKLIAQQNREKPGCTLRPENLAYMIYTSGSTGRPKGVMNTHKAIVNRLLWMQDAYGLTPMDRVLQKTPFSFDVSVWEFFWPLLSGATLVVARPEGHKDNAYLVRLIQEQQITTLHFVPPMLQAFLESTGVERCTSLRRVICSGQALLFDLKECFYERLKNTELHNLYGPTEAAVDVTYWACDRKTDRPIVPIGRPIANTQIYLLDKHLNPVPIGVPGELHIGGINLARGYWNRPDLTAEKFIPDPFAGEPGARLYKTGDQARFDRDGNVEFLGRIDRQVKIRGFRIEPGEIEAALCEHPAVQEAVVVAITDSYEVGSVESVPERPGESSIGDLRLFVKQGDVGDRSAADNARLVAYLVCHREQTPTVTELRSHLTKRLAEYMVPSAFVMLERLPLTPNGKIDYRALPPPNRQRPELERAFIPPRNRTEKELADIFSSVLGIDQVGIDDNYFALGGDSIRAIKVESLAQQRNLHFSLQQLLQFQTIRELAGIAGTKEVEAHVEHARETFSLINQEDRKLLPTDIIDAYPLSRVQAGLFFHNQLNPEVPLYHDIFIYHLRVRLDESRLQTAIRQVVDRHDLLRTSFDLSSYSEPLQLVHKEVVAPLTVHDLRHIQAAEQEEWLNDWIEDEKARPFDPNRAPLIRFFVHRLIDDSFHLILSFHDVILDGWSTASMLTELLQRYSALLDGQEPPVVSLPAVRYSEFVALERATLESPEAQGYWDGLLKDFLRTEIPRWSDVQKKGGKVRKWESAKNQPEAQARVKRWEGEEKDSKAQLVVVDVPIAADVSNGLNKVAQQAGVSLKHVLLAAHLRVMSVLSGQTDILTGLESNGRLEKPGGEQTLGIHLNTAPFRLKLSGGGWITLVREVFEAEKEQLPYRRFPYAELKKRYGPEEPLFETVFNYTHFHVFKELAGIKGMEVLGGRGFGQTHFTFRAEFNRDPFSDRVQLDLECDAAELCETQLHNIAGYYANALEAISSNPHERYETRCLLSDNERRQLLHEWNDTNKDYPRYQGIQDLFESRVADQPAAVAVSVEDKQLTYHQLNRRANQLAHYLMSLGIGPDDRVGLCVERSLELVVGIWGILKAGAAYVPLDPEYPPERLGFMLEQARVALVLTQSQFANMLRTNGAQTICLDGNWDLIADQGESNPAKLVHADNIAYVIYTSGSTGVPKGVMVSHRNLLHSTWARLEYYSAPVGAFLMIPSFAFDSSVAVLFWALCRGGRLVLPGPGGQREIMQLAALIVEHGVTHWLSVPALYDALLTAAKPEDLVSLRAVIAAGEATNSELVQRHFECLPQVAFYNEYGPTEATVWSTIYRADQSDTEAPIPLGKPIANTRIYLLDANLQPVPIGVPGELYIAGEGITRGYFNQPETTAECFIPDPFSDRPGERLYKTGDRARYRPDGNIEFLGRVDRQVKIRGFRIELGEIEEVLKRHADVREAAVVAQEDETGNKRLVAYIVPQSEQGVNVKELKQFLSGQLPGPFIPGIFELLEALPLTPTGKVDRRALPPPGRRDFSAEKMSDILRRVEQLSDDEAAAMLEKLKASAAQKGPRG